MIDYATYCEIHRLQDQEHLTLVQIADQLKLTYPTVQKWAQRPTYQRADIPPRPSKLDAFKASSSPCSTGTHTPPSKCSSKLKAPRLYGGLQHPQAFVRQMRPASKPAYLVLEFAPGDCAQVDWGSFGSITVGSTQRRLSFFVMVLCYSRLLYVEFTLSEKHGAVFNLSSPRPGVFRLGAPPGDDRQLEGGRVTASGGTKPGVSSSLF